MLPLGLLNAAQGHQILVELKNGENVNGVLLNCDTWMNLILKGVIQTSPEGDRFHKMPELYVRGNNIKYLRVEDSVLDKVKEQQQREQAQRQAQRGGRDGMRADYAGRGDRGGRGVGPRGGRGGRGRGRGG